MGLSGGYRAGWLWLALCLVSGKSLAEMHYQDVRVEPSTSVNMAFYDVSADSPASLQASLLKGAPTVHGGRRALGRAIYQVDWQLDLAQRDDRCQLYAVRMSTKMNVLVPSWRQLGDMSEETQSAWNGFMGSMLEYESWHKELVQKTTQQIGTDIAKLPVNASCQALRREADAVGEQHLAEARQQVRRYRAETAGGRNLGLNYPRF